MGHFPKVCAGAAYGLALAACVGAPTSAAYSVGGVVRNDSDAPVVANVQIQGTSQSAVSNSQGLFHLEGPLPSGTVVLNYTAAGYTPRSVAINLTGRYTDISLTTTLHAIDSQTQVTLPQAGQNPVSVAVTKSDGQVNLTIPPNSLVLPDGTLASGNANIALTYWHPNQDLSSSPGPLLTSNPNGGAPQRLRTYGMAAIEISQNGNLLQVAPGQTLPLAFTVPPGLRGLLGNTHYAQPDLYYMDHTSGLWSDVGSIASGALAYDPNSGIMLAQLPHLSEWNIDGFDSYTSTCLKGTVIDGCTGKPMTNAKMSIWFMAWEELSVYPAETDATGAWCLTHWTPDIILKDDYHPSNLTHIYVSQGDATQATNSSLCNPTPGGPIPSECAACASVGVPAECCRYQMDYQAGTDPWFFNTDEYLVDHTQGTCLGYYNVPVAECQSVCDTVNPTLNLVPCHVCPGATAPGLRDQCWGEIDANGNSVMLQLYDNDCIDMDKVYGPVTVSDGSCTKPTANTTNTTPPCPQLPYGSPCDGIAACCAQGLVCIDKVCVPPSDPTVDPQ